MVLSPDSIAQEFRWILDTQNDVDHVDANRNVYIADEPHPTVDIDFGEAVVTADINKNGTYIAKYDSALALSWYRITKSFSTEDAQVNSNGNGDFYVLVRKGSWDTPILFYLQKYSSEGSLITEQQVFTVKQIPGTAGDFRIIDLMIDSASNVYLSAHLTGYFSVGYSNKIDTLTAYTGFLAKYDSECNLDKVIRYAPNSDPFNILDHFERSNILIDTCGTLHCLVEKQGALWRHSVDTNGVAMENRLFGMEYLANNIRLIPQDSGGFMVLGAFNNAKDFNISEEHSSYLSPRGTQDIFFARFNAECRLQHVWQLGGTGAIELGGRKPVFRNNHLVFAVMNNANARIDVNMSRDTTWIDLDRGYRHICYDMSIFQTEQDTITYDLNNEDLVADINLGPVGSQPSYFVNFNDTLYFVANDGSTGYELWKSDGTSEGTSLVVDLNSSGDLFSPRRSSLFPYNPLISTKDFLYMFPDTLGFEATFYKMSDQTTSELTLVSDSIFGYSFVFNETLFVRASLENPEIFLVTDGTHTYMDTLFSSAFGINYRNPVNEDSVVYFGTYPLDTTGVWKFDGTRFSNLFYIDKPLYGLEKFGNRFYFFELDSYWSTVPKKFCSVDMTGSDYRVVFEFPGNEIRTSQSHFMIDVLEDKIIFTGYDSQTGLELYSSDGTSEQTWLIKDINPAGDLRINNLVKSHNGLMFFSADNGHGNEIFQTDGTLEGTRSLRGLNPFGKVNYNAMCIVKDVLYFGANNNLSGSELWKYNFITGMEVELEDIVCSGDSSQTYITLDVAVYPEEATDTSLVYSVLDDGGYAVDVDSLGTITINNASLKSALSQNEILVLIQARDGSGTQKTVNVSLDGKITGENLWIDNPITWWPNPAQDEVFLRSHTPIEGELIVYDIHGKTLMTVDLLHTTNAPLNISSLPDGMLIFVVRTSEQVESSIIIHH
ncbi:MAG: T9SS type A sorting domain-containing protein [Bacteroidota bacterium]